ncbi:DUF5372 family protein [Sinorhizobium sp. CCBAU 05631]|uniref:DUF5372 family protein n=1 Tax=Sinorhizobium sp. CCBAU 05631 TaxID=794846 RepID=UPI0004BA7A6B|nr:elements of external origin [Sinorhizobium sp. CCBAU 05631]
MGWTRIRLLICQSADADGRLRSLLASWTDVAAPDVFIQIAAGRSFVRPDDLATLAALIEQIERSHGG